MHSFIAQDDVMEEKATWQPLIPIDLPPSLVEPGVRSREKDVQYAREKVILQALYFSRTMYVENDWINIDKIS
jgi:protein phosphatase 1 regulatory subunit 10